MPPELTGEAIAAAMAKAEARVCTGADRCYALASDVESARVRCTPKGRCRVGLIVGRGGREVVSRFDVLRMPLRRRLTGLATFFAGASPRGQ